LGTGVTGVLKRLFLSPVKLFEDISESIQKLPALKTGNQNRQNSPAIEETNRISQKAVEGRVAESVPEGGLLFGNSGQEIPQARFHENLSEIKAVHSQGQGFDFVPVGCFRIDEQEILTFQPAQSPCVKAPSLLSIS